MEQIKITTSLTCRMNFAEFFGWCVKWWNVRLISELFCNLICNKKPINIWFIKWYGKHLKHVIKIILWSSTSREYDEWQKFHTHCFLTVCFAMLSHTQTTRCCQKLHRHPPDSDAKQIPKATQKFSRSRFTRANFCLITDPLRHCF